MADLSIGKLAAMLKPYILDLIGSATGGVGPFAPTPHDLSSSHHSGSILDAQAPQFLKTDGSRQLLGNLGVATGITVDGVDISVLKGDFDTHLSGADPHSQYVRKANADTISAVHTFNPASAGAPFALGANGQGQTVTGLKADQLNKSISAGTGLTGGGALTADRSLAIDVAASLTWTGNHVFQGSLTTRSILPELADAYDLGSADKLWRAIYASEFDTFVLKANTISVVGGKLMVAKGEGTLVYGVDPGTTWLDFGTAMNVNDIVLLRTLGQVEYMRISSLIGGTTYDVVRNLDGSGANTWPAGAVWVNLGYNGTGRIELDAESTPRISIKRQGTAYNTLLGEPVRIGDLNGWDSTGTERYGIGLGDFAGGNYMKYDGSVFELKGGAGGIKIDALGLGIYANSYYPNYEGRTLSFLRADGSKVAEMYALNEGSTMNNNLSIDMRDTRSGSTSFSKISTYGEYSQIQLNASQLNGQNASLSVGGNGVITTSSRNLKIGSDDIIFSPTPSGRKYDLRQRTMGFEAFDLDGSRIGAWICRPARIGTTDMIRDEWGAHHLSWSGNLYGANTGIRGRVLLQWLTRSSSQCHFLGVSSFGDVFRNWVGYGGWFFINSNTWNGLIGCGTTTFSNGLYVNPSGYVNFKKWSSGGVAWEWPHIAYIGTGWHFVWFQHAMYDQGGGVMVSPMTACIDGNFYSWSPTGIGDVRTPVGEFTLGRMETAYLDGAVGCVALTSWPDTAGNTVRDYYELSKPNFTSNIIM